MTIVCLEGASGVGKSTVAARLAELTGAVIVPEVNLLFERKGNEPRSWYFERQAERWRIAAQNAGARAGIAVLDGDPFQPLWYNWAYGYDFGENAAVIHAFYARMLAKGKIDFPDRYFILSVSEEELRRRRERDETRTRKNFERHLRFIRPQRAYFEFLNSLETGWVDFVVNDDADATARKIDESIRPGRTGRQASNGLFEAITAWLSRHQAAEFIS